MSWDYERAAMAQTGLLGDTAKVASKPVSGLFDSIASQHKRAQEAIHEAHSRLNELLGTAPESNSASSANDAPGRAHQVCTDAEKLASETEALLIRIRLL